MLKGQLLLRVGAGGLLPPGATHQLPARGGEDAFARLFEGLARAAAHPLPAGLSSAGHGPETRRGGPKGDDFEARRGETASFELVFMGRMSKSRSSKAVA